MRPLRSPSGSLLLLFALLPLPLMGGCATEADEEVAEGTEAYSVETPCPGAAWEGAQTFAGAEGTFERTGWASRELTTLEIGPLTLDGPRARANYEATRSNVLGVGPTTAESGDVEMLSDNPAFPANFDFRPVGAPSAVYFVHGIRRDAAGAIVDLCMGHRVDAATERSPIVLHRVP